MGADVERGTVRPGQSTSGFTAGGVGVNASDQGSGIKTTLTRQEGVSQGTELRGTDASQVRLPVYEATESGEPQVYGSGLNKKLDGSETHDAGAGGLRVGDRHLILHARFVAITEPTARLARMARPHAGARRVSPASRPRSRRS